MANGPKAGGEAGTPGDGAEQRSQELEARLAAIVESAPLAIVAVGLDETITDWNAGATRLFGWTAEEAIGRDLEELIETRVPGALTVARNKASRPTGTVPHSYAETTRRHKDGRELPVAVFLSRIHDPDGRFVGVSAIYQDLSGRDAAQAAIARSEEQFRLIADNAQDVIYRVDLTGGAPEFVYVSPSAEAVLGFPRERVLRDRRLLVEQTHPEDRDGSLHAFVRDPEASVGTVRTRWLRSDGRWITIEDRRTLLRRDGEPVEVVGIVRDVTAEATAAAQAREELAAERRVAEELRRLDEMRTAFLSAVSHELRTPLTSLVGFAETALHRAEVDDPVLVSYLERTVANAYRLTRLMDDLLDIDRLSRGKGQPQVRRTELDVLIGQTAAAAALPERELHLDLRPVEVTVDPIMMERVVDNLLRNIERHTPTGTTVWVQLRATDDGARLVIEDDGPGVDPDQREALFEPFRQGRDVTTHPSPGTGIGLSLVQRFVEAHGGRVWLDAGRAGGARFVIELPNAEP